MKIRCVLFDRDGTLGDLGDLRYPDTFVPFCNIREIFDALRKMGYTVGVITNQSSIARGTGANYDFDAEFRSYGADIWEICPHDTHHNCNCRKPKSGMLLSVASRLHISPQECLLVGDRLADLQCAFGADATGILVRTGKGSAEESLAKVHYPSLTVFDHFDEILSHLQKQG